MEVAVDRPASRSPEFGLMMRKFQQMTPDDCLQATYVYMQGKIVK